MMTFYSREEINEISKKKKKAERIGIAVIVVAAALFVALAVNLKVHFFAWERETTITAMQLSLIIPGIALVFFGNVFYKPLKKKFKHRKWVTTSEGVTDRGTLTSIGTKVNYVDWEPYTELTFTTRDPKGKVIERVVRLRADRELTGFSEGETVSYRTVGSYLVNCERI